jgi:hypothetical protein
MRSGVHLLLVSDDITPMMRRLVKDAAQMRKMTDWHGRQPLICVMQKLNTGLPGVYSKLHLAQGNAYCLLILLMGYY